MVLTNPVPWRNWVCSLIENADVFDFELDVADMKILNNLDEGFRVAWNSTKTD